MLQVLQDMRVVDKVRIRWHDRRERTLALVHARQDAFITDIDAYNDRYKRFTPCSQGTCLTSLRLKLSTNLGGQSLVVVMSVTHGILHSTHVAALSTLARPQP